MSPDSTSVRVCPSCGNQDTDYWYTVDSWVCSDCSYVLEAGVEEVESGKSNSSKSPQGGQTATTNWKEEIAVKDQSEANLVDVLSKVEQTCDEIGLSEETILRTGEVVTAAWETNFMHGRTKSETVGAAIYGGSRECDQAVPPGVIAAAVEADKCGVKQTHIQLKDEIDLDLDPVKPVEFVPYFCQILELPSNLESRGRDLLNQCGFLGGNPVGIAAASVYVASDKTHENITLQEIATEAQLTKETVWRHTSKLQKSH